MNATGLKSSSALTFNRMKLPLRWLLVPFLCAFALSARATTVIPPNFDQLVQRAQVIFEGSVTGMKSEWIGTGSERRIVTYVTFKVEDSLKGDAGTNYTMRMLGGTVDGQTMQVSDAPKFQVGDRDLLFVENNGSQFIPLVGIEHGSFRIKKDASGNDMIVTGDDQPLTDISQLGANEKAVAANRPALSVDAFKATVRARVQQQTRTQNR